MPVNLLENSRPNLFSADDFGFNPHNPDQVLH
jgi:hypothetical protein